MGWVKLDDQFAHHPKVLRVGPLSGWLHVCALTYCAQYLTDGFIPKAAVNSLADYSCLREEIGHVAEGIVGMDVLPPLLKHGLWTEVEGGYLIHDYLEYNPSRDDVLKKRRLDAERKGNPERVSVDSGRSRNGVATDSIPPVPVPHPVPKVKDGVTPPATQAPPKGGARRRRVTEVDAEFRDELEERYWEALGSREAARDVISDALNHAAATKHGDQRAYLRNWVRSEAEKAAARRRQPMSKMAAARAARPADDGPFEARAPCAKCGARESGKDSDLCVLCQMREAQIAKGMVVEVSPGVYSAA